NSKGALTSRSFVAPLSLLLLVLTVGVLTTAAFAQSGPTGSLSGVIQDPSGASVAGAKVTAVHAETAVSRSATAGAEGRWNLAVLPVGNYKVTVEATGFKKAVANAAVEAAVPRVLDIKMEVGEVTVEVNITDTAPLATPTTATTFRQLTGQELVQVPTSTRSFTHLLSAEAGVSSDLPPVLTNGTGNISPSVNGTRTTSTSLTFNGVDATNFTTNEGSFSDNISPAPETLSEVKLQTSLYDASTGRSGGGAFQLVTKSGGNKFNGSLYHYFQNEKLNANDFFFNRDSIDRPKARRNEGGFTIGGPVVKEKFFFFGGYQYTRANTGFVPTASSITVLPEALRLISGQRTAANLVAAFRQLNPTNFNLTEAQISPYALALLNLRNPATGDFFIPSPKAIGAGGERVAADTTVAPWNGGNPLIRQRNVFPAKFEQDQFTTKLDYQIRESNRLSGTFFFADFPGFDPFPDPSSLASPVTLQRNDKNRTFALSDTHIFSPTLINEARFGYFFLNNTRSLTDEFAAITNAQVGVPNPALFFDDSAATQRLGHVVFRNNLSNLSFAGPNDVFNRRKQQTFSFSDNVTWTRGASTFRFGGEYKRHIYDSNLPEEQATEFEKWENFTQFLAGLATEGDTQFGVTNKSFRMNDVGLYIATDLKWKQKTTFNVGLRWDWFGWPEEKTGRIGNFDFEALTNPENPVAQFLVPKNVKTTGFAGIDGAIAASVKAGNNHTLKGQDLNNFAPRFGFAFSPFDSNRLVVRGGYGFFFDRPSAAFINTIFSNYPFLREVEVTAPTRNVPVATAFSQQDPNLPFNRYLPNRIVFQSAAGVGTYVIRDGTPVTRQSNGTNNPTDLATGLPTLGNIAETFEFRAIDRNLRTPYVQQWNLGFQYELAKDLMVEARYVGTKGTKLLQAQAFNQGFDLNDPSAPDYIFKRFNDAYDVAYQRTATANPTQLAALFPNGALRSASTQRERGRGIAFGFPNSATGQALDYNLSNSAGALIGFEARGLILGFNIPEALLLESSANSIYHGLQLSLTKRFSRGLQFNTFYTWSKSMDYQSSDPGSTAGGGKPDVPNTGFVVQGNQRDLRSNRAVSDFDRTHRFSASYVYDLPLGDQSFLKGWQVSGFAQIQSGSPFSIFSSEPEVGNVSQFGTTRLGAGGLYRLGFGRPSLCGTIDQLRQQASDITRGYFNTTVLCSPLTAAGGYPNNRGFGNLGRNALRGPYQKRFDFGLNKNTQITERVGLEFRWDVFNIFNNVNFANPANDLQDATDFSTITNTIGGPRVMQFGLKLKF
ncbi:MAG: carboxypeptidase-like regulatory domain-containing protein, partial [Blastocatellia bacterium]